GYGTRDQIGASAYYTNVVINDYHLESTGALVGLYDRVELSVARQTFDTQTVGAALGLGAGFKIKQHIYGIKVRLLGDAVLDQDSWLPQIALGAQYKRNDQGAVVRSIGARDDVGVDYYLSATKIFLAQSLLTNVTLRRTSANQLGVLGFGGDREDAHTFQLEASLAYLVHRSLAIGVEHRQKPDNLKVATEEDWSDIFVAWAPTKNVTLTAAYTMLGNIALRDNQSGFYTSLQLGF
ncbi:MAG: DUF3034 family protein, partial [Bacteriovoracia bacterium]